ncbi:hypothetical protein CY35_06G051400 [Sphagnum magellanicum]|nr:hypothetical protein CY35_06G051400 [Sphagnum magellanicum]
MTHTKSQYQQRKSLCWDFFLTWRTFSASDVVVLLLPLLSLPTHHTTTPTSHFCLVSTAWAHTLLLRENRCKPHGWYESMTSSAHNAGLTGEEEEDLEEKQGKRRVCGVERKKQKKGCARVLERIPAVAAAELIP